MVVPEGATVPLPAEVKGVEASGLKNGQRVKGIWKDEPEGSLSDILRFERI